MTTQKQIEANQRNAQQSTGPNTPEGKAASRMNAAKHGILSEAVVVREGEGQEPIKVYKQLHHGLRDLYQPQDTLQEALVEQVAVTLWRKRRVLLFELGCIRQQLDHFQAAYRRRRKPDFDDAAVATAYEQRRELEQKLAPLETKLETLHDDDDLLTEEAIDAWENEYYALAEYHDIGWDEIAEADMSGGTLRPEWYLVPDKLQAALQAKGITPAQVHAAFREMTGHLIKDLQTRLEQVKQQEALELEQEALLGALPRGHDLDRIVRYEAALDRQLHRAITQLEKLQGAKQRGAEQPEEEPKDA